MNPNGGVNAAHAGLGVAVGSWSAGISILQINQYLQAGAFIVSMIAGVCAAIYYIRKSKQP